MEVGAVRLVDLQSSDLAWIEACHEQWAASMKWARLVGQTPSPAVLRSFVWGGVPLQQVAAGANDAPIALLQLVELDIHNRAGELAFIFDPTQKPLVDLSANAFLTMAFQRFPLRKLCFEVPAACNIGDRFGADFALSRVGRRSKHLHVGPAIYADVDIYEIWPE